MEKTAPIDEIQALRGLIEEHPHEIEMQQALPDAEHQKNRQLFTAELVAVKKDQEMSDLSQAMAELAAEQARMGELPSGLAEQVAQQKTIDSLCERLSRRGHPACLSPLAQAPARRRARLRTCHPHALRAAPQPRMSGGSHFPCCPFHE